MRSGRLSLTLLAAVSLVLAPAAAANAAPAAQHRLPSWHLVATGSTSHFRGLAAVSRKVVWLGGYDGTVLRTVDGGRTWADVAPTGAAGLQFRDISAFDRNHAVAMAAGTGTDSRLYETSDGGATWRVAYQNANPKAFFDCMSFFDAQHGLVLSDPVHGKFRILATKDGGRHWHIRPSDGMPPALAGEFAFAASGECLTTLGKQAWFGTGGGSVARVFHSTDGGRTWDVTPTPIVSSPSAGIFALAFTQGPAGLLGIATGGDFAHPNRRSHVAAREHDQAWVLPAREPGGYRSGATFVPFQPLMALAVGLTGSDVTFDAGRHWTTFDSGQFDTVSCGRDGACWASGDQGRVAKLRR